MKSLKIKNLMREWQQRRAPVMTERTRATNVAPVNVICDLIGEKHADQLTLKRVETFRNELLNRGMSKLTAARYLSTLRAGLGEHGEHLKIGQLIAELKRGPNKVECWTKNEALYIIDFATSIFEGTSFPIFVKLLFATGSRRGEALALHREDIDLERMRIHFHRCLTLDGGIQNGTKWGGERWCPLSKRLGKTIDSCAAESGLLFWDLDQRNVGRQFKRAVKKAGAPQHKLHCTRHSAISWALTAGMSLRKASEIFGVSQQTLEKHYAHFVDEKVNMDWAEL